jgi:hypothetical protein
VEQAFQVKIMFKAYQVNWSWDRDTHKWLRSMCIGRTLNFPCGMSLLGDVRADLDETTKPDIIADLQKPFMNFKKGEFDTVICDPPFSMYSKRKWINRIADLARKRLILSTPNYAIYLKKSIWKKQYYITEQKTGMFMIRHFQIFDRTNELLI